MKLMWPKIQYKVGNLKFCGLLLIVIFSQSCQEFKSKKHLQERRIVSLVPSLTDFSALVCPEKIVGVSSSCDSPFSKDLPKVGDYRGIDFEKITLLNANEIWFLQGFSNPEHIKKAKELGLKVVLFSDKTIEYLEKIPIQMDSVRGQIVSDSLRNSRIKLSSKQTIKKSFLALAANEPLVLFGENTVVSELLSKIGFKNKASSFKESFPQVNLEWFLKNRPEIVLSSDTISIKNEIKRKLGQESIGSIKWIQVNENILYRTGPDYLLLAELVLE